MTATAQPLLQRLEEMKRRYDEITQALSDPAVVSDREALQRYGREQSELQEAVGDVRRIVHGLRPPALDDLGLLGAAHLLAMDGRHDFIAVDTEFRRFVRGRYHDGREVADETLLRRYAKWGRWKYLAYWAELWAEVR